MTCPRFVEAALAATNKTFSDPLSTVIGMVSSTCGQLAETLSVGATLLDPSLVATLGGSRRRCRSTSDEGGSPKRAA